MLSRRASLFCCASFVKLAGLGRGRMWSGGMSAAGSCIQAPSDGSATKSRRTTVDTAGSGEAGALDEVDEMVGVAISSCGLFMLVRK